MWVSNVLKKKWMINKYELLWWMKVSDWLVWEYESEWLKLAKWNTPWNETKREKNATDKAKNASKNYVSILMWNIGMLTCSDSKW